MSQNNRKNYTVQKVTKSEERPVPLKHLWGCQKAIFLNYPTAIKRGCLIYVWAVSLENAMDS